MSSEQKAANAARIVSLAEEDAVRQILAAAVLDLWKVVNNLTRLRPSRRERYRVAIFGSARANPGTYCDRCSYRDLCPASKEERYEPVEYYEDDED